jgi:hypothetical protein
MKINDLIMHTIPITHEGEPTKETMQFIEENRNWDVANQRYRKPEAERSKTNLADCKIYWRGEYLIVEDYDGIIQYWESFPYCFLKQAFEFMELDKPAKWKTIDKLINLRMAIRQTEVNWCGYVDDLLVDRSMTYSLYKEFMQLARAQDLQHHGSHTF